MELSPIVVFASALAPVVWMLAAALLAGVQRVSTAALWSAFSALSAASVGFALLPLLAPGSQELWPGVLQVSVLGSVIALLVQGLGTVIGAFSARYLQGEAGQRRYVAALAMVLAAVHLLLLADHWLVLIGAWAGVGLALQGLLCFYPQRPFARLAAHKKLLADRLADALLLTAAALAWYEVGSGSFSALWAHIDQQGMSTALHISALSLVLAVALRTALLPVHGWLIQVMEAPTPVSALLHAGVVNLGGFVLIRFAPLLEQSGPARALLLALGLATAVLAGMVMLTRISIKVRLAWSTVAQMGFMVVECALGLYTLAALHLIGHSLYKAHAFLAASEVVRDTRLRALHVPPAGLSPSALGLVLAPALAMLVVLGVQWAFGHEPWPWWWSAVLGLAWAPLLWVRGAHAGLGSQVRRSAWGLLMVAGLAAAAWLAHALPLGLKDAPQHLLGWAVLASMVALYLFLAMLQRSPHALTRWRRWSYAGFYVDEFYTRAALRWWPGDWTTPALPELRPAPAARPMNTP